MKFDTVATLQCGRYLDEPKQLEVRVANFSSWRTEYINNFVSVLVTRANGAKREPYINWRETLPVLHLVVLDARIDISKKRYKFGELILSPQARCAGSIDEGDDITIVYVQHPDRIREGLGNLFAQTSQGVPATDQVKRDLAQAFEQALCLPGRHRSVVQLDGLPLMGNRKPERKRDKSLTPIRSLVMAKRRARKAAVGLRRMFWMGRSSQCHVRALERREKECSVSLLPDPASPRLTRLTSEVEELGEEMNREAARIREEILTRLKEV